MNYQSYNPRYFSQVYKLILNAVAVLNSHDYTPAMIEIMQKWQCPERLKEKFTNGTYYIALENDTPVGIGGLVANEICTMFVDPEHSHKGIGSHILALLEKTAQKQNLTKLFLSSTITAQDFYLHCGFIAIRKATHKLDGHNFEAVEMEKILI